MPTSTRVSLARPLGTTNNKDDDDDGNETTTVSTTTRTDVTPACFLRSLEAPCVYTAMRATAERSGGLGTATFKSIVVLLLRADRMETHAKRLFASLSEEKRVAFGDDWRAFKDALEEVTKRLSTALEEEEEEEKRSGNYMVTIAIEDDRDGTRMNVHALLTPLQREANEDRERRTSGGGEEKGEDASPPSPPPPLRYALLRGAPRERPHAKHTDWVKKREGLEIERNEWNAREDVGDPEEKKQKRKKTFVECVLSKRARSSALEEEEDFLLCEGLTTNVFVLKRDARSSGEGLILQTAPDADVLLGVARRAILDAFPTKSSDDDDKDDDKIRLSLTHPRWSERSAWIALFTVNCVVGAKIYHGIVNSYTGEELNFPLLPKKGEGGELASLFRDAFSSSSPRGGGGGGGGAAATAKNFPFDLFI
jgi:rubrerythrin